MNVTPVSPAVSLTRSAGRDTENAPSERRESGFSPRHVILDLSSEALQSLGLAAGVNPRAPHPPLFIYNQEGAFAYEEAAQSYQETTQSFFEAVPSRLAAPESEEADADTTPMPSTVSFDGLLAGQVGF